jgi:hypothetical protein
MENPKRSLKGVLKHGDDFKAKKIDFNDPDVKRMFEAIRKEQKKCLKRKDVDWGSLDRTYVNI